MVTVARGDDFFWKPAVQSRNPGLRPARVPTSLFATLCPTENSAPPPTTRRPSDLPRITRLLHVQVRDKTVPLPKVGISGFPKIVRVDIVTNMLTSPGSAPCELAIP